MDTSGEKYFNRMTEILKKKELLLKDMLYLTESQTSAIQSEDLDLLRKLVDKKQQKIEDVNKLDNEFEIYFERLKTASNVTKLEDLNTSEFPGARGLKEATAGVLAVAGEIREIEKINSQKSTELKKNLGDLISKVKQTKKINNAYNPASPTATSYYIDKKK